MVWSKGAGGGARPGVPVDGRSGVRRAGPLRFGTLEHAEGGGRGAPRAAGARGLGDARRCGSRERRDRGRPRGHRRAGLSRDRLPQAVRGKPGELLRPSAPRRAISRRAPVHARHERRAERGNLVEVDLAAGEIAGRRPLAGARYPNDVAVAPSGTVYVSDSAGDAILRSTGGEFEVWLTGGDIGDPNALEIDGDRLLVGNNADQSLKSIDLAPGP